MWRRATVAALVGVIANREIANQNFVAASFQRAGIENRIGSVTGNFAHRKERDARKVGFGVRTTEVPHTPNRNQSKRLVQGKFCLPRIIPDKARSSARDQCRRAVLVCKHRDSNLVDIVVGISASAKPTVGKKVHDVIGTLSGQRKQMHWYYGDSGYYGDSAFNFQCSSALSCRTGVISTIICTVTVI